MSVKRRTVVICAGASGRPGNIQFKELAAQLAARGDRVIYVSHDAGQHVLNVSGVRSLHWPSPRPTHIRDVVFMIRLLRECRAHVVIASFGAVNAALIAAWTIGVPQRIPWFRTLSEQTTLDGRIGPQARLLTLRKRWVYRLATRLVAVSEAARDDLSATFGVPPKKIVVIPTCRPDPQVEVADTSRVVGGGIRAVCVGRLNRSKGHDVLLQALQMLPADSSVKVECIGGGSERTRLEAMAHELGVSDRVVFSGALAYRPMLARLVGADMAILPYRTDAGPGTVAEALGMSLPVIASNAGGLGERLKDSPAALLVPPEDPRALATALDELCRDGDRRARMASAARREFLDRFHLDRWLEAVVTMIEQPEDSA